MRAMEYLVLVVIIGLFMFLTIDGAREFNNLPVGAEINTSMFSEDYDQTEKIMLRVNESFESFQKLGDEETSWFEKIGSGIVAIPLAVINFPIIVATAVGSLIHMVTITFGGVLPATVVLTATTLLLIEVVRRFMEFFQRSRS